MPIINPHVHTSQEIDNSSFDESLGVKIVEIIGADGVLKNPAIEANQISQMMTRIATNSGDSDITYTGMAKIGSDSAGAVWKITKYDDSVDEIAKFAGTGIFDQIWDNRESLSYV